MNNLISIDKYPNYLQNQNNLTMQEVETQKFDFIIIGAGIAGLQAGLLLAEHNKSFIIIEASSIIGGRIATSTIRQITNQQINNPNLNHVYVRDIPQWIKQNQAVLDVPVDYGATWVADSNQFMIKLLKEHHIEIYPQIRQGNYVFGVSPGKFQSLKSLGNLYEQQDREEIQKLLNSIHKLKNKYEQLYQKGVEKQYPDKLKQFNSFLDKYDSMTVEQYIKSQIKDNQLVGQLLNFIECLQCMSCDKFSMMQLLDDDDSLEILNQTVDKLDESDDGYRVKTGMRSLLQSMQRTMMKFVKDYNPDANLESIIKFNEPVVKIQTWQNKQKQCRVHTHGKYGPNIYSGKRVLNSIPLATMNKIQITNLSIGKKLLYNGQQCGIVNRIFMVFRQPFWRKKYNGYGLFSSHFPFNEMTELTPLNLSCGIFAFVFYAGKYEKWVQQNPDPKVRFEYLKNVVADMYLKGDRQSQYLNDCFAYMRTFTNNQYIKAGYQPTTKLGVWKATKDAGEEYAESFENDQNGVYNIGTQFDNEYGSYMEGAIRITRKKVYQLLSKSDPWKK